LNKLLAPVFDEILPALEEAGIRCCVFGGVGVAGVVGSFFRENPDVDTYVFEEDFPKVEAVLKGLCEKHGDWDWDVWKLSYSMMKTTSRPKFEISIRGIGRFSIVPVYEETEGIFFKVKEIVKLPSNARERELKEIEGFKFYSASKDVIETVLRSFVEKHIAHHDYRKPPLTKDSSLMVDVRMIFGEEEVESALARFAEVNKEEATAPADTSSS
jgi:hypothetical protein